MRILVIGGYGLIGASIARALAVDGHEVVGLGRSMQKGKALVSEIDWIEGDLALLTDSTRWHSITAGFHAVVNASGVLQSGFRDNVEKVQKDAIVALIASCEANGVEAFVQISAPGAEENSDTAFYRTKAAADEALKASRLRWTIFRPGLVLSSHAYGGTSLLRAVAACPFVQPIAIANVKVQTVFVDDVAAAVLHAINSGMSGSDVDLVAPDRHALLDIVLGFRRWLGFAPPRRIIAFSKSAGRAASAMADVGGWFGWRSPLRSSGLRVLASNVTGDAEKWPEQSELSLLSFEETLARMPATAQERIYARAMFVFPILVIVLGLFWLISGVIGLWRHDEALAVFGAPTPGALHYGAVYGGALIDIAIGVAVFFRPLTRAASILSVIVAGGYLVGGALFAPHLWSDPLGPMVKVFPAMALALVVAALAEER